MRIAVRALLIMTLLVATSASGRQDTPAAEPSVSLPPDLAHELRGFSLSGGHQSPIGRQTGGRVFLFLYTDDFWHKQ